MAVGVEVALQVKIIEQNPCNLLFKVCLEGFPSIYALIAFHYIMQKLWMMNLPSLDLIGGPVEGLVCVVTGPTSGIGKETATELARRGAHGMRFCGALIAKCYSIVLNTR